MKKLLITLILIGASLSSFTAVEATSGFLKKDSIITCSDGKQYGNHGDGHWHSAVEKDGRWYAQGDSLGMEMPAVCKEEAPKETPKEEKPKETPKAEEPKEAPKAEKPKEAPKAEKPKETPKAEKPKEAPKAEKPKETPKVEKPKETPKVEEPKETPKVEEPKETPKELAKAQPYGIVDYISYVIAILIISSPALLIIYVYKKIKRWRER